METEVAADSAPAPPLESVRAPVPSLITLIPASDGDAPEFSSAMPEAPLSATRAADDSVSSLTAETEVAPALEMATMPPADSPLDRMSIPAEADTSDSFSAAATTMSPPARMLASPDADALKPPELSTDTSAASPSDDTRTPPDAEAMETDDATESAAAPPL